MCFLSLWSHVPDWTSSRDACELIKQLETRKPDYGDAVAEVKHGHDNSFASIQCALVSQLCIAMHKRKASISMLSRSKAPKTQTTGGLQTADQQKNYQTFFDGAKQAFTLAPEIIFFAKVSVPV